MNGEKDGLRPQTVGPMVLSCEHWNDQIEMPRSAKIFLVYPSKRHLYDLESGGLVVWHAGAA